MGIKKTAMLVTDQDLVLRRLVLGGLTALVLPLRLEAKSKNIEQPPPGRVAHVYSGDSFALEDGRRVRLGSIEAPRPARSGVRAQPLAGTAKAALAKRISGRQVRFTDPAPDRFSRIRAQVYLTGEAADTPLWVQGNMVRRGLARVRTWRDDHAMAAPLLALEQDARAENRGLWAQAFYALRTPQSVAAAIGSFQIVQGRVVDAARVRGRVYLNFGPDWRTDFTISIAPKDSKSFERAGIALDGLSGALVRARGLIRSQNGPILYLDHPEALQVLAG